MWSELIQTPCPMINTDVTRMTWVTAQEIRMLLPSEAEIQSLTSDKFPNPNAWLMLKLVINPTPPHLC